MKSVRRIQRAPRKEGGYVYYIIVPPKWAREFYPGEVLLDIEPTGRLTITPLE